MGLLDKIKNALFEEEYVEVEEKPKKIKKEKPKKEELSKDKPVAKRVILPGKKNVKVEELHEEELIDEDFEIRPKQENNNDSDNTDELMRPVSIEEDDEDKFQSRTKRHEFKMLDDDDFKTDDVKEDYEEPEIVQVIGRRSNDYNEPQEEKTNELLDDDYQVEYEKPSEEKENTNRHLYGMSEPEIKVSDYGSYEKKEEKGYFRPSPIISPIYGILDRNYRKEDVVSKKDVRLASSYSRQRVDIDDIRNKAYGNIEEQRTRRYQEQQEDDDEGLSFEIENPEENSNLVDLSEEENKPTVKEVTVGDAVEYFEDLGLEYNVDYVDASKGTKKKQSDELEDTAAHEIIEDKEIEEEPVQEEPKIEEPEQKPVIKKEKKTVTTVEVERETVEPVEDNKPDPLLDTNDNLFDLIDSMYQENE